MRASSKCPRVESSSSVSPSPPHSSGDPITDEYVDPVRLNLINHPVGFISCQICLYFSN